MIIFSNSIKITIWQKPWERSSFLDAYTPNKEEENKIQWKGYQFMKSAQWERFQDDVDDVIPLAMKTLRKTEKTKGYTEHSLQGYM